MKLFLATLVSAATLAMASTPASAWVCRADGMGSTALGYGRSVERAKYVSLRRCERGSLLHVCTIRWCRR
jgi:hypothetical protein